MPTTAPGAVGVPAAMCASARHDWSQGRALRLKAASGSTEVGDAHVPAALPLAQQHIRRLDVAVHDLRASGAHCQTWQTWSERRTLSIADNSRARPEKGVGRALCLCTTSRPVATSRRMYNASETCGPKQIWAEWRATGGGLAFRAGPGQLATLRARLWSSSRLRAERSQRSITSSRCACVSALRTRTHASAWAEV